MVTDRDKGWAAFEKNKALAKRKARASARPSASRVIMTGATVLATALGLAAVFPEKFNDFFEQASLLQRRLVDSWVEPLSWHGIYSNYPEGLVNSGDYSLTTGDEVFVVIGSDGSLLGIDGYIQTDSLCGLGMLYPQLLLRGTLSMWSNSLKLVAYDIIEGKTVELGGLTLRQDGIVLTVEGFLLHADKEIRLAKQNDDPDQGPRLENCLTLTSPLGP